MLDPDDLDQVFFSEARDFLANAAVVLESPVDSISADQLHELHRCAHSIKGAALMIGFEGLGRTAGALAVFLEGLKALDSQQLQALWPLVCEAFDHCALMLQQLAAGADRNAADDEWIARLQRPLQAQSMPGCSVRFLLSPLARVSSMLVEDMLDELQALTGLSALQLQEGLEGDYCRLELPADVDLERVREALERIADPGSVVVESASASQDGTYHDESPLSVQDAARTAPGESAVLRAPESGVVGSGPYLTLAVDSRCFAVQADAVEAVAAVTPVQPYPVNDPAVLGVIEFEGQYLRVFDLKAFLGLGVSRVQAGMQIITRFESERVGVQVDRADGLVDIKTQSIHELAGLRARGIQGEVQLREKMYWLLDLPALLKRANQIRLPDQANVETAERFGSELEQEQNETLETLTESYGHICDELLSLRALAMNLALSGHQHQAGVPQSLIRQGFAVVRKLSHKVGKLGDEIDRLTQDAALEALLPGRPDSRNSVPVNYRADALPPQNDDAAITQRQKSASGSGRESVIDEAAPSAAARKTGRPGRSSKTTERRTRPFSGPLPRIGRGRNALEEQWFEPEKPD